MTPLDKNYLSLQFWMKIHSTSSSEFQSFFESVMDKVFPDFRKIRPYGKYGDGGNDGYINKQGIYYQVYSPVTPDIKEADAAKKMVEDFDKLKIKWSNISEIKKYCFVYNDKNQGSTIIMEQAIADLQRDNPNVEFEIFNSKKLEETFYKMDVSDILGLGFNIDSREAIKNAREYIKRVEIALDQEYAKYAQRLLNEIEEITLSLKDDQLKYEITLQKARALQKAEKVEDAKKIFEQLSITYPDDSRAILYLARIYRLEKNYDNYRDMLNIASKEHWLYDIEVLINKIRNNEDISRDSIKEETFPDDSRAKSNYYRLYSIYLDKHKDHKKANHFIEKAISHNSSSFINYDTKLALLVGRALATIGTDKDNEDALKDLLTNINIVENEVFEYEELSVRAQISLLLKKLNIYRVQENISEYDQTVQHALNMIMKCYYDDQVDENITAVLWASFLPKNLFDKLIEYLLLATVPMSDQLSKSIVTQYVQNKCLYEEGLKFFQRKNNTKFIEFISAIINNTYSTVIEVVKSDLHFAIAFVSALNDNPILRKMIIDSIPDAHMGIKNKLLLRHFYDLGDYDSAYNVFKKIDISGIGYIESLNILDMVNKKEAWDVEISVINIILSHEKDENAITYYKMRQFQAYYNMAKYSEAIQMGRKILAEQSTKPTLAPNIIESLLAKTIQSHMNRNEDDKALQLLMSYDAFVISPEIKISCAAEVYILNKVPTDALDSIVSAVKMKRSISPEEYANLFYMFVRIEKQTNYNLESLERIQPNHYVKLTNQDRFYYIGEDEEIDCTKIDSKHEYYNLFIDKKVGDEILFPKKYSSTDYIDKVEHIFTIEKYLLWKSSHNIEQLARECRWDGARMIEVPPKDNSIDTQYLEKFMKDMRRIGEPLYELYCDKNIPLAILAKNEGGLPNAISRITQEKKGFIKFSSGVLNEMEAQKEAAINVIVSKKPFVIDGTSALFMAEIGYFQKIHSLMSNIIVPQSVLKMLFDVAGRLLRITDAEGSLNYAQERLIYTSCSNDKYRLIKQNIDNSIKIIEEKLDNIVSVLPPSKMECLSEREMLPELCDACIIAQERGVSIMTEDYLYLQMNEYETKKKAPKYFSSITLLRALNIKEQLSYDDYLMYFGYLTSYRGRFLSINADDIYKAIFGDNKLIKVRPENIRQLNFPFTLSEEYGVTNESALKVLMLFLIKILVDDTVLTNMVSNIFMEILNSLPSDKYNKEFSIMLIDLCVKIITKNSIITLSKSVQHKVDKCYEIINVFNYGKERSFLL